MAIISANLHRCVQLHKVLLVVAAVRKSIVYVDHLPEVLFPTCVVNLERATPTYCKASMVQYSNDMVAKQIIRHKNK